MSVEVGVKGSFKKKLMRSLKWARRVERMRDEKLAKRSDAQNLEGKRTCWFKPACVYS